MDNEQDSGVLEHLPGKDYEASRRSSPTELKGELLSFVVHEMRTPLTAISAVLKLMEMDAFGSVPTEAKARLQMANNNLARMMRLVNDLLDAERLESGMMRLDFRDIPTTALLEQAIACIEPLAGQKGIRFEVSGDRSFVYADEDRIIQVLVNLLCNAVKFSPVGATIKLVVRSASDSVEFIVRDEGRGIPAEKQQVIFHRYRQVLDGDCKSGSGLGLWICKYIIEAHGGAMGVSSETGKGASFWFRVATGRSQEQPMQVLAAQDVARHY